MTAETTQARDAAARLLALHEQGQLDPNAVALAAFLHEQGLPLDRSVCFLLDLHDLKGSDPQ